MTQESSLRAGKRAATLDTARRLMADPMLTVHEVPTPVGVSRTTLYRAVGRADAAKDSAAKAGQGTRAPGRKPRPPVPLPRATREHCLAHRPLQEADAGFANASGVSTEPGQLHPRRRPSRPR